MPENGTARSAQLSQHELAYYRHLLEQAERVPELQEQQRRLAVEITKIRAAQEQYLEFLTMTHALQPGDLVEQSGRIVRRTTINTLIPSDPVDPDPEPEHPADVWRREHPESVVEAGQ